VKTSTTGGFTEQLKKLQEEVDARKRDLAMRNVVIARRSTYLHIFSQKMPKQNHLAFVLVIIKTCMSTFMTLPDREQCDFPVDFHL
jgi:hypothetical protein